MKKYFLTLAALVLTSFGLVFAQAPVTNAATFDCGDTKVETSIDFGDYTKKFCDKDADAVSVLILIVIDFLAVGVGVAVVIGIAWGGLIYSQAGGDASKTKQAVSIIINAVIGLVLFIFMYALVNFFVPGGIFT